MDGLQRFARRLSTYEGDPENEGSPTSPHLDLLRGIPQTATRLARRLSAYEAEPDDDAEEPDTWNRLNVPNLITSAVRRLSVGETEAKLTPNEYFQLFVETPRTTDEKSSRRWRSGEQMSFEVPIHQPEKEEEGKVAVRVSWRLSRALSTPSSFPCPSHYQS